MMISASLISPIDLKREWCMLFSYSTLSSRQLNGCSPSHRIHQEDWIFAD